MADLLSLREAADYLRVSMTWLRRVNKGPKRTFVNGRIYYREADILAFIEQSKEPARPPTKAKEECNVYVIFNPATGLTKLGVSRSIERRKHELEMSCGVPLNVIAHCRGGYKLEQVLHEKFSRVRRMGEWFELTQEDHTLLKEVFDENDGRTIA